MRKSIAIMLSILPLFSAKGSLLLMITIVCPIITTIAVMNKTILRIFIKAKIGKSTIIVFNPLDLYSYRGVVFIIRSGDLDNPLVFFIYSPIWQRRKLR
jgi:hypothetical protein